MMTEEAETEATVPPPAPVIVTEPVTRAASIFDGILPPDVIDMIPSMPAMGGILSDPIILGAVGGVIILLLILVILKRRKSSSDDDSGISASGDEDLFAADEEEELTPIHLADGGVDVVEPDETDIKIPTMKMSLQRKPMLSRKMKSRLQPLRSFQRSICLSRKHQLQRRRLPNRMMS